MIYSFNHAVSAQYHNTRYTVHGRGAKTLRLCKFTTNHNTQSSRFFNFFINWQEHVFSRVQKRCPKVDPNLTPFAKDIYTLTTFFQFLKNLVFKTPLSSEVCPPLTCHPQKVIIFRTPNTEHRTNDGRTDGHTEHLVLTSLACSTLDGESVRFGGARSQIRFLVIRKCMKTIKHRPTIWYKSIPGVNWLLSTESALYCGSEIQDCSKVKRNPEIKLPESPFSPRALRSQWGRNQYNIIWWASNTNSPTKIVFQVSGVSAEVILVLNWIMDFGDWLMAECAR